MDSITDKYELTSDGGSTGNEHKSALIYINKDYVVQWESTENLKQIFKKRAYIPGEVCYKTNFNREAPCKKCVLSEVFSSQKQATHIYREGELAVEITGRPIYGGAGDFIGGILQLEEINTRIQQEKKIKELNHIMDAILNNIPVYLFVKDPANEFRYLYWNKAMAENTQIPVSNVLGKTDFEVFPSEADAWKFRKDDLTLLEKGSKIEFQEEYVAANGETRTCNTLKTLIPIEGKSPWMIGISWDITELKKTEKELIAEKEKAEQSNRLKSAFLANMSHEIRTPLNAIVGFSDLLSESTDEEERQEYIKIVKKNNELLLQLISDILDLSKIEAQSLEFVFGPVDVNALCSSIVAASNLRADGHVPVILTEHLSECFLYTDRNRLNQVISNLVNNALKFTKTGCVMVGYRLNNDSEIEFYVQDTGTGIPDERKSSIFERFIKLDSFVQGTGLGLSICKSIVERLNGRIGVESKVGIGSRFWFTHPYDQNIVTETDDKTNPEKEPVFAEPEIGKKPTVLIAEDIDSNYLLLQSVLKKEYNLIRAFNGKIAVEKFHAEQPDIILMDIKMPVMDGLEATRIIRETNTAVPIVALTAYAFDSDIENTKEAGCTDFLSKPIAVNVLKEKIRTLLRL